MPVPIRRMLACLTAVVVTLPAIADDKAEAKKQTEIAQTKLKAAKITNAVHIETEDLLVFAVMPEAKVAPLAASLQKTHAAAAKALKYDAENKPFTGKLGVYLFADDRQYKSFVLDALKRPTLKREQHAFELRGFDGKGDAPFLMDFIDTSSKPSDATITTELNYLVAAAVLNRKAGVGTSAIEFSLPEWLTLGFGQAAYLRAEGNKARLAAHQSKVKAIYAKTQGKAFSGESVWGGKVGPDTETLNASLAEYLAFGPESGKFGTFISAFKPADNNGGNTPDVATALMALEWKIETLEAGWRSWVAKGK